MKTILIAEDDASLNKNIAFALESEGFSVIRTSTIAEAEKLFPQADLLLLDVMLPDGSGIELCRIVRRSSKVPVIFLTASDTENDIISGLDSGGDDYITKPFRLRVLISRINAALRRCGSEPAKLPELTAVEHKLLEYLMLNRDRFVTREQLLEYLWDSKGIFVNDNTLSVNISRLREKLGSSCGGQIITKRGIGYKWTD